MIKVVGYKTEHMIEENHIYCANWVADNTVVKGHRLLDEEREYILNKLDDITKGAK